MIDQSIEEFIFSFIDQCKLLFFPEQWNSTFLNYSKNEVFAMLFVYRKGHANMTEIADYIGVPLNTATGIVSRLEKRGLITRERDVIDKRVVTIVMKEEGKQFLADQLKLLERYYHMFMEALSEEEKKVLFGMVGKFLDIVTRDILNKDYEQEKKKTVKKIIIE